MLVNTASLAEQDEQKSEFADCKLNLSSESGTFELEPLVTLLCLIESRFPTDSAMLVPIPESHEIKSIECTMFTTAKPAIKDTKITDSGLFHTDTTAGITTPMNFLEVDWNEVANTASVFPRKSQGIDRGSYYGNGNSKPDTTPGPKNVFPEWAERRRQGTATPFPKPFHSSKTIPTGGPRHVVYPKITPVIY